MSVVPQTSTFRGVSFALTNNQMALVRPGHTTLLQKDPIPYSDDSVVQIGGTQTDDLSIDVLIDAADWDAFAATQGAAGTLTLNGDAARTAILKSPGVPKFYREGVVIASATFVFV
jgi:hypothetical protein